MEDTKPNAEELDDLYDCFRKSKVLFMSDVEHILATTLENRKKEDSNYDFGMIVQKAFSYAKRFSTFKDSVEAEYVRKVLEKQSLLPHEIAMLGNLCPDQIEEALHLIPSLKVHMGSTAENIENAILEINKFSRQ